MSTYRLDFPMGHTVATRTEALVTARTPPGVRELALPLPVPVRRVQLNKHSGLFPSPGFGAGRQEGLLRPERPPSVTYRELT